MDTLGTSLHYGLHFIFPALVAWVFFRRQWKWAYVVMLLTMLVDLDHLLATPIFDPDRCSIGFHPLHTQYAIMGYLVLWGMPPTRIVGLGLLMHMATDYIDCYV